MEPSIKHGTLFGTALSIVPNLTSADLIRTMVLACVGAVSSFVITLLLKRFSKKK